eukprot:g8667.t1
MAYVEGAADLDVDFPNAIYLDAMDLGGLIRTGTATINPLEDRSMILRTAVFLVGHPFARTSNTSLFERFVVTGHRSILRPLISGGRPTFFAAEGLRRKWTWTAEFARAYVRPAKGL